MYEAYGKLNKAHSKPEITLIIVNKRTNSRFFRFEKEARDNKMFQNVLSGTVIESDIVQ